MISKNFIAQIIIRLLLILLTMALILIPLTHAAFQDVVFLTLIFSSLLVIQVYFLFQYLKQAHQILKDTIQMLNAGQYSSTPIAGEGFKSIEEFSASLNKTINSFRDLNARYQSQLSYLQSLVEIVEVGILSLSEQGKIVLSNSAANHILGLKKLIYLEDLKEKHPILFDSIQQTEHERQLFIDLKEANAVKQVSIKISAIEVLGKKQKLVVIQNISGEVIKTETEAWNRLLKILNHEIFNSVTPLSSLSNTLSMIIKEEDGKVKEASALTDEEVNDIAESIEIIKLRSNNLMNFINGFKKLAKVPPPKVEKIELAEFLKQTVSLFKNELEKKKIEISVTSENDIEINADRGQLEQALINLISNSIHALEKKADCKIELRSFSRDKKNALKFGIMAKALLKKIWIGFLFLFSQPEKMVQVSV